VSLTKNSGLAPGAARKILQRGRKVTKHGTGGRERNEIWHKSSQGNEDDARASNTRRVQRKCAIPHSTMKTHRNMWRPL